MKSELELRWDGSRRFAKRCVRHLEVAYTEAEKQAHRKLSMYSKMRSASAVTVGEKLATDFVLKLLKKRMFSSPASCAVTLEKHARSVGADHDRLLVGNSWHRQIEEADNDFANDEEGEAFVLEVIETASRYSHKLNQDERTLLQELREFAANAAARADSKARCLIAWLKYAESIKSSTT